MGDGIMERADHVAMIVQDASWLAHRYDPGHDAIHFMRVDRETLTRTAFLTEKDLPRGLPSIVLGRAESIAAAPAPAPLHLILHSGYCCSTLLARAFDRPGSATVLKEPTILNDLVGWKRRDDRSEDVIESVSGDVLRLLARSHAPNEAVVVKPSNILNGMAAPLLLRHPDVRALLLHAPLPVYLGSIARKGIWGALWVREHLIGALQDGIVDLGFDRDAFLGQTDLQIAAMGWLAQQRTFQALVTRFGMARVRTIDSETLLARRSATLLGIGELFGLPLSPEGAADIAEGPVFTRHSKFATPFAPADRMRDQADLPADRRDEIEKVIVWTGAVAKSAGVPMTLGAPLLD
jgi:hypothetical protein